MSCPSVTIILRIVATNQLWVPIAFMSCALVAIVLCIAFVYPLWQSTTDNPKFKIISRGLVQNLVLIIAKQKLLQRRPRIARRNSTTGRPSSSLFPSNERRRSQTTRRQSTTDLPSKALWSKIQYKPSSLMGIFPEIRLMIYDHIFPSEIKAMSWTCHQYISYFEPHKSCRKNVQDARYFRSSLLQVHPKIYQEAKKLLWNRTVFGLGCTYHANRSLGSMSWISRRLIKRIETCLVFDRHYRIHLTNMSTSILTMNAMARGGLLESVTILVSPFQLRCIMDEKLNGTFQFDLLRSFGNARTWSCKRSMRIVDYKSYEELLNSLLRPKASSISDGTIIQNYKDLFEELHQAWGGTLYLDNTLVWENGRHVYRAPPSPVTPRKPFQEMIKKGNAVTEVLS
ncbi:hypothetical protein BOTCAL_0067g00150 [Botryotinia calthae]|uniref:F-box domain-containing protein n=1 Tax=Botryotinia calthae TaxID=38488 RepID=A0A4Y8DBS3_9HELO|nr:hypothetical protein BOTCAL_0067g00150 [Botryotinia calthae]